MIFETFLIAALAAATTAEARVDDAPADRDGWFDITVLQAHVRSDWTLQTFDQVQHCDKILDVWRDEGRAGRNHYEHFDCTRYIEGRTEATAFKALPIWVFRNGFLTTNLSSPLAEVYTVVPLDRMEKADFLGFSEAWLGGRVNLFKANGLDGRTREAGKVRLKDGRIGVVHRWIALFDRNGWTGSFELRSLPFKPVLVRQDGGDQRRYWDPLVNGTFQDYVLANYKVTPQGRYEPVAPQQIDRRGALVAE